MILVSNFVLLGAFVFIATVISAPLLYSKWRLVFRKVSLRSPPAQPGGSLLPELIPKPTPSALERASVSLTSTSLILPFALLRLFSRPTTNQSPLASDLSINTTQSSLPNAETSTEIAQEPMTTRSELSIRTLRRFRRQGWLVHLSSRELTPLTQRLSFSPTLSSTATVLSDIGNTHRDTAGDSFEQIFSPQIIERSAAGNFYCDSPNTPMLYPVSPFLNSPIPLLVLTSATAENNTGLECADYSSVVHIASPLGPSFLTFALPSVLACSEGENSVREANNMLCGDGTSDSFSEFLDKFPSPPPPVDSVMESCEAPTSLIEKENSLMSPVHPHFNFTTEQATEQKATTPREHETVDYLQESAEYRPGCHNERIKASRSECIIRTFPVRDRIHHSLSMPFGMASTEIDARGLGFFSYNYVNPVKG